VAILPELLPKAPLPKKGRGQKAAMLKGRDLRMCPMPLGLKPLTLVMKNKENMYFALAQRSYILRPY